MALQARIALYQTSGVLSFNVSSEQKSLQRCRHVSHNYTVSHLSPSHCHIWRIQSSFDLQRCAECVRVSRGWRCASAADISVPCAGGSSALDRISQHTPQWLLRLCTGGRQMPCSQNLQRSFMGSSKPLQIFITPPLIKQPSLVVYLMMEQDINHLSVHPSNFLCVAYP